MSIKYPEIPSKHLNQVLLADAVVSTKQVVVGNISTIFPPDQTHKWELISHVGELAWWRCETTEEGIPRNRNGQPRYSSREEFVDTMRSREDVPEEEKGDGRSESEGDTAERYDKTAEEKSDPKSSGSDD